MAGPEVPAEPAPAQPVLPDEATGTASAAEESAATETARRKRTFGDRVRATPRFLASIPVTLTTVGLLLLTGALTGTLFTPASETDSTITALEFGLPAFREGRIWTLFTGAVTFVEPEFYFFVGAMLAVGLGLYERRVGSLRAAVALIVCHSIGIVVPALLLWPLAGSGWPWAATLANELDAGLSAGGFGVAAAATALLTPPWRGRLRVLGTAFLAVMVIKSGLLWDLEHFVAWVAGLLIGPRLARQAILARTGRPAERRTGPAETRMLTALIAGAFAISNVVDSLYPGIGGIIGPGVGVSQVRGMWLIILELVISLLIAGALPRATALAWWVAVAGVAAIAVNSLVNTPVVPRTGDVVCALIVLGVLLWNHNAWPWRTDRSVLRPLAVLAVIMLVFAAVTSVAIWAVRQQFQPVGSLPEILREAIARFTFTTGPLLPQSSTARGVLAFTGVIWGLLLVGWLAWALYYPMLTSWRRSRREVAALPSDE